MLRYFLYSKCPFFMITEERFLQEHPTHGNFESNRET